MNVHNFLTPSFLVIFKLAKSASYLAWLFDALKEKKSAHLATTSGFIRVRPASLPSELDALSTRSIYVGSRHFSVFVLTNFFIGPWAFYNEIG